MDEELFDAAEFHVDFSVWSIIAFPQEKIITLKSDTKIIFPLFTDEHLAEQFIEDEFPEEDVNQLKLPSEYGDAPVLLAELRILEKAGCEYVGFDPTNRSASRIRLFTIGDAIKTLSASLGSDGSSV